GWSERATAAVRTSSDESPVRTRTLEYGSDGLERMAMEGPETVVTSSETGSVAALSPMTIALPEGMVPMETGKRMGRESASMPNQDATMPAACRALGEGGGKDAI